MRFDRESYRKLYVRESAEDRMMPLLARGLRDYLLRHAAEDGTLLKKSQRPHEDLGLALSVHRTEMGKFKEALKLLVESGYLSFEGGRLWITRFEEAQEAKSPGARRTANWRANQEAKKASQEESHGESHGDAHEASPRTSQVTSPLAERKKDEKDVRHVTPKGAVPCPDNLWELLPAKAKATLETGMIPRWAQEQMCRGFEARMAGKAGNERTLDAWFSTVIRVIQGDWNDPNKRPKKPVAMEPDEPPPRVRSYAEIEREEQAREEAARAARAAAQ